MKNLYTKGKDFLVSNYKKLSMLAMVGVLAVQSSSAYAVDDTLDDTIAAANTGFHGVMNMDMSAIVTWAGSNLIKPIIGSGLGVLYNLRWWIIALVVISALVYFAFRGFRFFKH